MSSDYSHHIISTLTSSGTSQRVVSTPRDRLAHSHVQRRWIRPRKWPMVRCVVVVKKDRQNSAVLELHRLTGMHRLVHVPSEEIEAC